MTNNPLSWKPNDRALCINDKSQQTESHEDRVKEGTIYLVELVDEWLGEQGLGLVGMRLDTFGGKQCLYRASRFRKIVPACDRKQKFKSISIK